MVYFGYLTIIAYLSVLIVLSEKIFISFLRREYCRKILHIGTFATLPLANTFWGEGSIHFVIISFLFSVFTFVSIFANTFSNIEKREKKYHGIFYYALSLLVCSSFGFFWKESSCFFPVAFIGLAFGDGFATLIGSSVKNLKIHNNKTVVGFISCFLITFIAILIYNKSTYNLFSVRQILLLAILTGIVELVDYGLDNLVIPISLFFACWATLNLENFSTSLLVFETVFVIAFFGKAIYYYGALLASLIGSLFFYYTNFIGLLFVVGCYAILISIAIFGKKLKNDVSSVVKKTKAKDFVEVFVNGVWVIVSFILFALTSDRIFSVIAFMALSEGFVDSVASDIGTLSKKKPYDIFRKKSVEKGVSGGMTLLGSVSSFSVAFVFAFILCEIFDFSYIYVLALGSILFAGCFVDSLLGSLLQVKYQCRVCGKITEKEEHCEKSTIKIGGCKFINNDTVNLLSGFFVFSLSFVIFLF